MQKRTKKPSLIIMQIIGYILLFFSLVAITINLFPMTISSLLGIISMLLILPETIDFFIYILKNFPQGAFSTYKGKIVTLPLLLIFFIVLFIISLKK